MSERDCEGDTMYQIWFYFTDNIPFKWAALMQIHMGSGFQTLKQTG